MVQDAFEALIVVHKRGKDCVLGKLVVARPLNAPVIAMPYRHRAQVENVSLPVDVINWAKGVGAAWWVVRLDKERLCYGLSLDEAMAKGTGFFQVSAGVSEWFVPLAKFKRIKWQEWRYVDRRVKFGDDVRLTAEAARPPEATQERLF